MPWEKTSFAKLILIKHTYIKSRYEVVNIKDNFLMYYTDKAVLKSWSLEQPKKLTNKVDKNLLFHCRSDFTKYILNFQSVITLAWSWWEQDSKELSPRSLDKILLKQQVNSQNVQSTQSSKLFKYSKSSKFFKSYCMIFKHV